MSNSRGSRALRKRPSSAAATTSEKKQQNGSERKMRSLQSLQERFCFTLKRPRTSRARPSKGGPNSSSHNNGGKSSTLMENGLIQIPYFHCDYYYESPTTLSLSSNYSQENNLSSSSSSTSSASSSITQVGLVYSGPVSSLENSSDDGFSSDEVMSLMGCSDLIQENVLDFMPSTIEGHGNKSCPDMCEKKATLGEGPCPKGCPDMCEKGGAIWESSREGCCSSSVEDDGEPYRIDLCDFEPDVSAVSSCSNEQQEEAQNEKKYGGEVLCLRLDYEEVLRAWKERGEFFIAKEPSNYPSPYLDPFHTLISHSPFVPHPPYF